MPSVDRRLHALFRNPVHWGGVSMARAALTAGLVLALLPAISSAQATAELPAPLAEKVVLARQACAAFDNGEFTLAWGAVTRVDLDGDLRPDWVLDERAFVCSSAVSLYCGTGGCMSHFLVGDVVASLLNRGWDAVTFGRDRVVLTDVHGSECGGINPTPCVMAHVWDADAGAWRSVATGRK